MHASYCRLKAEAQPKVINLCIYYIPLLPVAEIIKAVLGHSRCNGRKGGLLSSSLASDARLHN